MKMSGWILVVVVAGLVSWSGKATCDYYLAKRELLASKQLAQRVDQQLADARAKVAQKVARVEPAAAVTQKQ